MFSFLAKKSLTLDTTDQIVSTLEEGVICKYTKDIDQLSPCDHEEADMRIFLHLADCVRECYLKFLIRTVDTDVVLAVCMAKKFEVENLWVAFGTGKRFHYLAVHEIVNCLGPEKSLTLPMFFIHSPFLMSFSFSLG